MKARLWQWSLGSVMGAFVSGLLFMLLTAVRPGDGLSALLANPEPLLMVIVVAAIGSGLATVAISAISRRPIVQIMEPPATAGLPLALPIPPVEATPKPAQPAAPLNQPIEAAPKPPPAKLKQAPFVGRLAAARLSPDLRWEKLSRLLQKLLGISGKKLRGASMLDRIHAEDRTVIERRFLNPSKVAFDAKFRLLPPAKKTKDPKPAGVIYVQLTAAPLRDVQNKVHAWRCLFTDVTRQVQAEESRLTQTAELAQAQAKWQRIQRQFDRLKESYFDLYHNAPVMYFSLDAEGRFVTLNDTLLRTLGYERDDLLNHKYTDFVSKVSSTPVSFELPSDKEEEWETQLRRKDGRPIDVWLRTVAVFDEQGKFARWRSSALDLTERNRLANELRAHTEELQRTNTRLRHINSELEAFTHVVSHDLKEPLRTLQAYSQLLAEDFSAQLSTDGFQYVNHLLQASQRLGRLIDELLNLSQAGRAAKKPEAFNLIEVVATVRRDLVDLIQRKEATIQTEGTLPNIIGDSQRITQLLSNLVANGLKYNQNPAPCVTIGQALKGADDRQVIIFVRDNGIGIDPKHHQKIFGLFRRLNNQDEYEGTGAGLAICKKIVEGHGGRIWVDSAPGQGSTFYFTLPRPAVQNGRAARASRTKTSTTTKVADRGIHILLVEDIPAIGEYIQKLGQRSGLRMTWFKSAEESWDWLQVHRPDFMLLDINLPGMNGTELCRRIRRELRLETPIALISQAQESNELAKFDEIGADHFLSKEFLSQRELWQKKLDELLAASLKPAAATA